MAANLVLVVEDNPDDETLTLRALRETGGAEKIVVAHDGAEALDFLLGPGRIAGDGSSLPRLVLLDLRMPRVDGFEVLRRLRAVREVGAYWLQLNEPPPAPGKL